MRLNTTTMYFVAYDEDDGNMPDPGAFWLYESPEGLETQEDESIYSVEVLVMEDTVSKVDSA